MCVKSNIKLFNNVPLATRAELKFVTVGEIKPTSGISIRMWFNPLFQYGREETLSLISSVSATLCEGPITHKKKHAFVGASVQEFVNFKTASISAISEV